MPSLAELPDLTGFFSYSRRDDEHSQGSLSRLRAQIFNELRLQLGRDFKLFQDTVAIPEGTEWEDEIKRAISESEFFIPIVTPSSVASTHCRTEFEAFLEREETLGRKNLVFPLLYVRVPALEKEELWRQDALLGIIGRRQYFDWQRFRHRSLMEGEIAERIEQFCQNIVGSLQEPWVSAAERRAAEEAKEKQIAEQARRDQEEKDRQQADAEARLKAEQQRAAEEAEARRIAEQASLAQEAKQRQQAEAEARAKAEQQRRAAEHAEEQRIAEQARRDQEHRDQAEKTGQLAEAETRYRAEWERWAAAENAEARRAADQKRPRAENEGQRQPEEPGQPRTSSINLFAVLMGVLGLIALFMILVSR
jgi:chemotaxis protein histidine kinase CheA